MSQQEVISQIVDLVSNEANPPEPDQAIVASGKFLMGNPTAFKPNPPGAGYTCRWTADFNYAQGIALCNLISDPAAKAQCLKANEIAYCNAHDACGVA